MLETLNVYSCFEEGCLTKGEKLTRQCQESMGNGLLTMQKVIIGDGGFYGD